MSAPTSTEIRDAQRAAEAALSEFKAAQVAYERRASAHAAMVARRDELAGDAAAAASALNGHRDRTVTGFLGWLRGASKRPDLADDDVRDAVQAKRLAEALAAADGTLAGDRRELAREAVEVERLHRGAIMAAGRAARAVALAAIADAIAKSAPAMRAAGLNLDVPSDALAWACPSGVPASELPAPQLDPFSSTAAAQEELAAERREIEERARSEAATQFPEPRTIGGHDGVIGDPAQYLDPPPPTRPPALTT